MAAAPRKGGSPTGVEGGAEVTTPQDYPRTTPPLSAVDHSWVLQTTMEIQKSIGKIGEAIETLREETKSHGEKLAKFEKVFYAASIIGTGLIIIGAFLVNKLWDPVVAALIAYAKTQ